MSVGVRPPGSPLATLRVLSPYDGIFAYYDGRTGERFHSEEPNWLDDGAFTLGVATYSIVSGTEAMLFDAAITTNHAAFMLSHVRSLGVTKVTTVYSHFHKDHIAGASAFGSNTLIGQTQTAATMRRTAEQLAREDPPVYAVLPNKVYEDELTVQVGDRTVKLLHFNIHTLDGTVLFLPQDELLFVGDTLEDTATFIDDAVNLSTHQKELKRMAELPFKKILPAHGCPIRIASGGYDSTFIDATLRYIQAMNEPVEEPAAWTKKLSEVVDEDVMAGNLIYFEQYEDVHQSNIQSIQKSRREGVLHKNNR